jgi:RNA polymerase sigma-70 factor (ECF subfamily)
MPAREVRPDRDDLIDRARAGDRAAFGRLVELHQHEVFTLALRLTGDRELAADVSQEAFVRAWQALPRFRGDSRFGTWLHRIVVNTAWSQRRKAGRHRAETIDGLSAEPAAVGVTPEQSAENDELRAELVAALGTLSMSVRAVVVLKDVYDWSHREIAEHLGITITAAKVRLHRGRRLLRERLWHANGGLR